MRSSLWHLPIKLDSGSLHSLLVSFGLNSPSVEFLILFRSKNLSSCSWRRRWPPPQLCGVGHNPLKKTSSKTAALFSLLEEVMIVRLFSVKNLFLVAEPLDSVLLQNCCAVQLARSNCFLSPSADSNAHFGPVDGLKKTIASCDRWPHRWCSPVGDCWSRRPCPDRHRWSTQVAHRPLKKTQAPSLPEVQRVEIG